MSFHQGFFALVFAHDAGTFTVLFVRPSDDRDLAQLRQTEAFKAACRIVPGVADWTDPVRSDPIDVVRAGAGLTNEYTPQPDVRGLAVIGDAFSMTNPQGGRGLALGMMTAAALADLVATGSDVTAGLDAWGRDQLRPWFDEHVVWDADLLSRWAGRPVTADSPIGLKTLLAAAQEHPEWMATIGPFFGMAVLPSALDPLRDEVRAMVRAGWQPPPLPAPDRGELAVQIHDALLASA